jgi:glycosyltransferase involved in cell wall biosynthesis
MARKKILFVISEDWAFLSHRLALAKQAMAGGFEIVLFTKVTQHKPVIEKHGIRVVGWGMERGSLSAFQMFRSVWQLFRIIKLEQPDIIHTVAVKPVLLVSLISVFIRTPKYIYCFGGLGFIFNSSRLIATILKTMISLFFRFSLGRQNAVSIVQNQSDLVAVKKISPLADVRLIQGMGIDFKKFIPAPKSAWPIKVILPARMLRDKGIFEFFELAKSIKLENPAVCFELIGGLDLENKECISAKEINEMQSTGYLTWRGYQSNMIKEYQSAHIICFPSYHEGFPKVLLEASSCGVPIVCFDIPGCNDVVVDGVTGFLVPFGELDQLRERVSELISDGKLRRKIGNNARNRVLENFSEREILRQFDELWYDLSVQ